MRRLAGYVALALAVLMVVSSSAMAFDFTDHVKIAPNKKGDVLIFPVYAAAGQWDTKFTVINTAIDRSVVAKVIFRSAIYSQELLDFLIYLTPTDVWTGVVRFNASTNKVEVFSDDDSVLSSTTVWGNTSPFVASLITPTCVGDISSIGYVEVIESAHSVSNVANTNNGMFPALGTSTPFINLNQPAVIKNALLNAYQSWPTGVQNVVLANDGINSLTGIMELRNTSIHQKAALEATVLRDYDATLNQTPASAGLLSVVRPTVWGESIANNSIGEVEAAIAKNELAMYYSDKNLTIHFFTFPTKLAYNNYVRSSTNVCTSSSATSFTSANSSPYFRSRSASGCVTYQGVNYNLSEASSMSSSIISPSTDAQMCDEIKWLSAFAYTEGWARYSFLPTSATIFDVQNANAPYNVGNDGDYTGAPVLGTVVHLGSVNDGYAMVPAAYSDGLVRDLVSPAAVAYTINSVNPTNYYYYQYQDERNMGTNNGYDADLSAGDNQTRPVNDAHHPRN